MLFNIGKKGVSRLYSWNAVSHCWKICANQFQTYKYPAFSYNALKIDLESEKLDWFYFSNYLNSHISVICSFVKSKYKHFYVVKNYFFSYQPWTRKKQQAL